MEGETGGWRIGQVVEWKPARPARRRDWRRAEHEAAEACGRWHVAMTKPAAELATVERLEADGHDAFTPWHWRTVRHARKAERVRRPLFPRYVFVRVGDGLAVAGINRTPGVSTLLHAGGRLVTVAPEVMDRLRARCGEDGAALEADTLDRLRVGDQVRVTAGPLEGLAGYIRAVVDRSDRVVVEFGQLRIASRVHIPVGNVKRVEPIHPDCGAC